MVQELLCFSGGVVAPKTDGTVEFPLMMEHSTCILKLGLLCCKIEIYCLSVELVIIDCVGYL